MKFGLPAATLISARLEHFGNGLSFIWDRLAGRVAVVNSPQSRNAFPPMAATPSPNDTDARLTHPRNASPPMVCTLPGMATDSSDWHSPKAKSPIVSTPLPMVSDSKDWQPQNAPAPKLLTLSGISTRSNLVQAANATSPMLVAVGGISNEVISQDTNACSPMAVTGYMPAIFAGMTTSPSDGIAPSTVALVPSRLYIHVTPWLSQW